MLPQGWQARAYPPDRRSRHCGRSLEVRATSISFYSAAQNRRCMIVPNRDRREVPPAEGRPQPDWYSLSLDEVERELGTGPSGLPAEEAAGRLERYGKNVLREEARETRLQVFLRQFKSVLIVILIVAAGVSFFVGAYLDAVAILIIVVLNAILGFSQEWQAGEAIEALKKMLVQRAVVIRVGGSRRSMPRRSCRGTSSSSRWESGCPPTSSSSRRRRSRWMRRR